MSLILCQTAEDEICAECRMLILENEFCYFDSIDEEVICIECIEDEGEFDFY